MSGLSTYPGGVDSWVTKYDNVDDVLAAHVNKLQDAMLDVQTKLGATSSIVITSVDYFITNASGAFRTHTHAGGITDGANIAGTSLTLLANIVAGAGKIPVANIDTGTTANKILMLNASAQIPAVSGALVTSVVHTTGDETIAGIKTLSSKTVTAGFTLTANCDFAKYQAVSFVIENRTSEPTSPTTGQIWLRTDL